MRFSEQFGIERADDDDWFDPVLTADTQLFVDPFRIYVDDDERWRSAHDKLIDFFNMVLELVAKSGLKRTSAHWKAAQRLLTFPEPPEFCLGYGVTPFGLGTAEGFGAEMLDGAATAVREGLKDVRHFEELTLFAEGVQEDRISDIVCNVLKSDFIAYTQEIAEQHGVKTEKVYVPHVGWDRQHEQWLDDSELLPRNSAWSEPKLGIILVPARFLRQLPTVMPAEFWDYAWEYTPIKSAISSSTTLARTLGSGRSSRLLAPIPISPRSTCSTLKRRGRSRLMTLSPILKGRSVGTTQGFMLPRPEALSRPKKDDEFCDWVKGVLEGFAHNVEHQDGWILLWTKDKNGNDKPGPERYGQALLRTAVFQLCPCLQRRFQRRAERGPRSWSISSSAKAGNAARARRSLRTNSSQFWDGLETQTVQYMKSEKVDCGYFVVVAYRDADFTTKRMNAVRNACKAVSKANGYRITPISVDARRKKSASKLRTSQTRRRRKTPRRRRS